MNNEPGAMCFVFCCPKCGLYKVCYYDRQPVIATCLDCMKTMQQVSVVDPAKRLENLLNQGKI